MILVTQTGHNGESVQHPVMVVSEKGRELVLKKFLVVQGKVNMLKSATQILALVS